MDAFLRTPHSNEADGDGLAFFDENEEDSVPTQ